MNENQLKSALGRLKIEVHDGYEIGFLGEGGRKKSKIVHAFWGGTGVVICPVRGTALLSKLHLIEEKCTPEQAIEKVTCKNCKRMLANWH